MVMYHALLQNYSLVAHSNFPKHSFSGPHTLPQHNSQWLTPYLEPDSCWPTHLPWTRLFRLTNTYMNSTHSSPPPTLNPTLAGLHTSLVHDSYRPHTLPQLSSQWLTPTFNTTLSGLYTSLEHDSFDPQALIWTQLIVAHPTWPRLLGGPTTLRWSWFSFEHGSLSFILQ